MLWIILWLASIAAAYSSGRYAHTRCCREVEALRGAVVQLVALLARGTKPQAGGRPPE